MHGRGLVVCILQILGGISVPDGDELPSVLHLPTQPPHLGFQLLNLHPELPEPTTYSVQHELGLQAPGTFWPPRPLATAAEVLDAALKHLPREAPRKGHAVDGLLALEALEALAELRQLLGLCFALLQKALYSVELLLQLLLAARELRQLALQLSNDVGLLLLLPEVVPRICAGTLLAELHLCKVRQRVARLAPEANEGLLGLPELGLGALARPLLSGELALEFLAHFLGLCKLPLPRLGPLA
mmetsp:Transcript_76671/g.248183  ORF Transcript_76671/g.248183 Transcript_76671/m.248183 type:complete len:243 (-) Transcript_76671:791-1519(-)